MSGVNDRHREDHDNPQAKKYRRLFVGGLERGITEKTLKEHFEQWGEIAHCIVMRYPQTKKSRCFGFITYKTAEMLDDAQNNRPHRINNQEIDTKRAIPRKQSKEGYLSVKQIFVGGLKYRKIAEDDVREVFGRFGKIEKVEMFKYKNSGKNRGFCFITFDDFDSVDKCLLRQPISIGGKFVEVKKAIPKDQDDGIGSERGCFNGFDGGMSGRGGDYNNGYDHQGNYGYPGDMGGGDDLYDNGGYQWYGNWHHDYYASGMGGYYGNNDFVSGYGSRYGGGPTQSAGFSQTGAATYTNYYGAGDEFQTRAEPYYLAQTSTAR